MASSSSASHHNLGASDPRQGPGEQHGLRHSHRLTHFRPLLPLVFSLPVTVPCYGLPANRGPPHTIPPQNIMPITSHYQTVMAHRYDGTPPKGYEHNALFYWSENIREEWTKYARANWGFCKDWRARWHCPYVLDIEVSETAPGSL